VDAVMEEIEDPFQYADAAVKVALEYHKAGDSTKVLDLLAQASEIVKGEEVYGEQTMLKREALLDELAIGYATAGHYEEALPFTELMVSEQQQYLTLGAIAKLCITSGNYGRVFEVTERIKDSAARVFCEVEIVDALVAAEQTALADHALTQTVERASAIERPYPKAQSLIKVAPRLARRNQTAKAAAVLLDALTALSMIDDSHQQSLALIFLDTAYRGLGLAVGEREAAILEEMLIKLE
jgi:hypothetical protein